MGGLPLRSAFTLSLSHDRPQLQDLQRNLHKDFSLWQGHPGLWAAPLLTFPLTIIPFLPSAPYHSSPQMCTESLDNMISQLPCASPCANSGNVALLPKCCSQCCAGGRQSDPEARMGVCTAASPIIQESQERLKCQQRERHRGQSSRER